MENTRKTRLTQQLEERLERPQQTAAFDFATELEVLMQGVGLSTDCCGGKVDFFGLDPIIPSRIRFGTAAALALAAKNVAAAAIWRDRSGEGQDIHVDVRKALRRFCAFLDMERRWELLNDRPPALGADAYNPFLRLPLFHETRDGRQVMPINIYPRLRTDTINFLRCSESTESVRNAILQWRADELEDAAAERGLVLAMVRSNDEFRREPQYDEVLADTPLVSIEKIGESAPEPLARQAGAVLSGIRALGMGHVIAGAAIGRDLAFFGADVLNVWRPNDTEVDSFFRSAQVGMRSTVLGDTASDREQWAKLLQGADIFFANRRPGFLDKHGLGAEESCARRPGLIHVTVNVHGDRGPWSNRPGFDEIGAAVAGIFAVEGSADRPKAPPIVPICDYVTGWLGTLGTLAALRRRATEGGSYRVSVSLTRTVLWQLSLGIFDLRFARATAGSSEEHTYVAPDLFTAETPLGTYQGLTEQVVLPKSPGAFRFPLLPRGACKPEWLAL